MERIKSFNSAILSLDQVYITLSHIVLFQICEIMFLTGPQKATYLYTLMFYNVVSYCANYLREIITRKQWSPYVTITETSQVKHLAMSATKITLEWTKFLIFALTAVFILLTVGFAQEVEGVHTSVPYLAITFLYYLTSETIIREDVIEHVPFTKMFKAAECREKLFGHLFLKLVALFIALVVNLACLIRTGRFKMVLVASYFNIYLRMKDIMASEVAILGTESERIKSFRIATEEEIRQFSDVCAICLGDMKSARSTRCRHLFHEHCLSLAIDNNPETCPTCKTPFFF